MSQEIKRSALLFMEPSLLLDVTSGRLRCVPGGCVIHAQNPQEEAAMNDCREDTQLFAALPHPRLPRERHEDLVTVPMGSHT